MKIYTKTGDKGTTSLIGGRRVEKSSPQVEVYGQIDELNASIGVLAAQATDLTDDDQEFLRSIQVRLFRIGGFYSFDFESGKEFSLDFLVEADVRVLELEIDRMQALLPPLKNFILPGGCLAAAQAHLARTVCRRVERVMDGFKGIPAAESERENLARTYINRLSDYLFVLALHLQALNGEEDRLLF